MARWWQWRMCACVEVWSGAEGRAQQARVQTGARPLAEVAHGWRLPARTRARSGLAPSPAGGVQGASARARSGSSMHACVQRCKSSVPASGGLRPVGCPASRQAGGRPAPSPVSFRPPVLRTTGTVPYRMAIICGKAVGKAEAMVCEEGRGQRGSVCAWLCSSSQSGQQPRPGQGRGRGCPAPGRGSRARHDQGSTCGAAHARAAHAGRQLTWVRPQGSNMEGTRNMSQPA